MSGFDWTPDLVATYIHDFAAEVRAELDRVEREMKALVPTSTTYCIRYTDAAELMKKTTILTTEKTTTVLAYVQMRTAAGAIYSACIWADWETGEVSVTGWPLAKQSGWPP